MKPKVLILDEPTAGLDPKGRDEILDQVDRLHKETEMTVILVSHSMEDVARYVDRILVMNRGEIYLDGAPREIFQKVDELRRIGLTVPETVKLLDALRQAGWNVPLSAISVEECADAIAAAMQQ